MGKKDAVTKEYMRDPAVFADAFNQYLYHGREVIRSEDLKELDTTEIAVPYGGSDAGVPEQKYRDVLKLAMTDGGAAYCILGVEGQDEVHYAMPVRNGGYDFMQLSRQVAETAKSHKREGGGQLSPGEYLGGFYKADKLLPVVTLVIFFGSGSWDGPLTLREMYAPVDEAILRHAPDYEVNLIAPGSMSEEEIGEFRTSLKEVMLYIKHSKDKEKLQEVTERDENFRNLERQAAEVINAATGSKLKYPEGKEAVDVCAAIQEMRMESLMEGRKEGRKEGEKEGRMKGVVETYKEVNFSLQDTIQRVAEKFDLSLQQSEQEVRKYWK